MNERCTVYIIKRLMNNYVPALYDRETERLGDLSANFLYCRVFSLSRSVAQSSGR